jgi:L,D-transpeptidase YbiS
LWLGGLEIGKNRGGNCDTQRRYIYIHGTAHEDEIGKPVSHGCIRMRNDDMLALYDRVHPGTIVTLHR